MQTEQQSLTGKLKKLEFRYRALFEGTKELVFTCFPDGKIININSFGIKLLGYTSRTEVIGQNFIDLYFNPADRNYYKELMTKQGYIKDFEVFLKTKTGEIIIGLETAFSIKNTKGQFIEYTGIIKDITARVKAEMVLRKKNMELEEINKKLEEAQLKIIRQDKLVAIGQLAAGVAHEINNPLSYIKSSFMVLFIYLENIFKYLHCLEQAIFENNYNSALKTGQSLLETKNELKIDTIIKDVGKINKETDEGFTRIVSIINSLKNFAHIDNHNRPVIYNLNEGVENTLQILQNEIKYVAEVEKKLSPLPSIECYGGEINQVLLNILLNAAQAIKSEKKNIVGKISVTTECQDEFIVCTITDNGPGIPEQILNKIFDPFFTTKDIGEGTGLGLSISYDIIQKHHGKLLVQSTVSGGTTFTILLPKISDLEKL